jgi:hypothetical protein
MVCGLHWVRTRRAKTKNVGVMMGPLRKLKMYRAGTKSWNPCFLKNKFRTLH